ncbi:MAG TPA: GNAT family N-acetyltransferase [Candidatus Binataceae bacterium]|nr:GNAT family N-acetyltransferase [Candidatus Binataceae bacterium]
MSPKILSLEQSQIGSAAAMFARAFQDDPLMAYALPDPRERAQRLPEFYSRMVRFGGLAGEVLTTESLDGAAVWLPPNARWTRENIEAAGLHELGRVLGEDAVLRYREVVSREMQARSRDGSGPTWYLLLLGVEPSRQRRGLGAALLKPVFERADRERLGCYLETENQRNVKFYHEQGFSVIVDGEMAGDSGVRFWTFRRATAGSK